MALARLGYTSSLAEYKMSQQQNILKRKRSFKRRRFTKYIACISMAIICLMAQGINRVQAAEPAVGGGYMRLYRDMVMQQQRAIQQQFGHQRYIRDVGATLSASLQQQQQHHQQQLHKENLKDSLQQSSSTEVTFEQPQGQCLLDGEYVPETTVFCEKQVGCRAIQKTGHCCPDYKCDCQKDGKTYLNGYKLVDPETPCTVCYCQGGEILCSSVTCFHRDDCTPKYIPGVCCPEYDNCPVVTSESSTNKTLVITSTTTKPEIHQAENNPKITIKEITKPIEIRITNDNKAIPIQQMLKPSTTSTTSTTTTTTTTTSPTPSALPTISTQIPHTDAINAKHTTNLNHNQLKGESSQMFSEDNNQLNKNCKNTVKGGINTGEILKLSASVAYPPTALMAAVAASSTHAPLDSSAEVEDPVPALSVFSTQGLPQDPSKVNIKREYFVTTEGVVASGAAVFDGFESGEYQQNLELLFTQGGQVQNAANNALQQTSAELDPDTAGSDNIYHIILTTEGPRLTLTSENYLAFKGISTTEGLPFDDLSAASSLKPIESNNNKDPNAEEPLKHDSATESAMQQHLDEEDSAIPLESNPAYPSLPEDDFSLRDNNFQINDVDDLADEPRSISVSNGLPSSSDAIKSTKHLDDQTYGSGSGMLLDDLAAISSATTESSGDQSTQDSREQNKAKQAIHLLYSAEESSAETKITNSSDFKNKKILHKATIPDDNTSLEAAEFGSGSEEIKQTKEREPTTARPNKNSADIDIDEIQDASGHGPEDDPKLDAESLKLDETAAADSSINSDKSAKNNILSVRIQPAQNKKFHDNFH